MTAAEFAFLALGLVLGIATGAALIEVLRARPPVAREVRVTVSPNAIQSRLSSTLADPRGAHDEEGPARGGPADRRGRDEILGTGEPAATGRRVGGHPMNVPEPPFRAVADGATGTPVRVGVAAPVRRSAFAAGFDGRGPADDRRPGAEAPARERPPMVAVPMSMEPDPITAALRASAAGPPTASAARVASTAGSSRAGVVTAERATSGHDGARSEAGGADDNGVRGVDAGSAGEAAPALDGGPCAEERRIADERCAVAGRAREGAATAAGILQRARREHDDLASRVETAAATADARRVRAAKERAQQQFRDARHGARTRDDVEAGARAWLAEINRINQETRDATIGMERDRAAEAALGPTIERLEVEADVARIAAERADEACLTAREAVANCDEARALETAARRSRPIPPDSGPADPKEPGEPGDDEQAGRAAATADALDPYAAEPMASRAEQGAVLLRILRGDHAALQHAITQLGGDDEAARRLWQVQLGALVEALIARSIEASALDFPLDHFFWGPFTQSQNRDISAGLASLGFRFDGFGGWVDDRVPSQRDLSLAVGYAGLDPMRVRRWPTEPETQDLLRDVRVAADEYVIGAAGGLSLGELVTTLGRRADGLTELWNQWGLVRPVLLEAG